MGRKRQVRLFAFTEGLEILLSLLAAAMGQTVARERVSRLGGALGHFLFDALGDVAFDVRAFNETAECGGAATVVLAHLGFAGVCRAPIFGAIADSPTLTHRIATGLTVRID